MTRCAVRRVLAACLAGALAMACASLDGGQATVPVGDSGEQPGTVQAPEAKPQSLPAVSQAPESGDAAVLGPDAHTSVDLPRLTELVRARSLSGDLDYPIGPGDLIEIRVPAMPELEEQSVRVSGDGSIALPLLGSMEVAGLTEAELQEQITQGLAAYMHQPEFSLLVVEHRNRQVGVLGAVEDPGLHPLEGRHDTILEMIAKAGGLTSEASQRILFLPVEADPVGRRRALAAGVPETQREALETVEAIARSDADAALALGVTTPIVIELDRMNRRGQRVALSVPVRPGDTIMVLGGGKIFVQGWVENPGAFDMTRGVTVLSAVAQAGGFMFAGKRNNVHLLRERSESDDRQLVVVDVAAIEAGLIDDIVLREGDVLDVKASAPKAALYALYLVLTNVLRVGLSVATL